MIDSQEQQKVLDQEHLKLLSLFYYISGGVTAFFASFPLIHVFVGLMIVFSSEQFNPSKAGEPSPEFIGWLFVIIGGSIVILGWLLALAKIYVGRCISRRKHRIFCLIIAGISCLGIPYGTVLGIFTFIVLMRHSVKLLFEPDRIVKEAG